MKRYCLPLVLTCMVLLSAVVNLNAQSHGTLKVKESGDGFVLSAGGKTTALYISKGDYEGVVRAFRDLQQDISKVTGVLPALYTEKIPKTKQLVIAGTLGNSEVIDRLIKAGKINPQSIQGKWETFCIQVVSKPFPGIKEALVIVGSDKRGAIYGIYELSSKIGVSPWYWWDDVPVEHKSTLVIDRNIYIEGPPAVKYRGIFLNDEYPNLTNWVMHTYGMAKVSENPPVPEGIANYGREFYSRLFELILRLKGNYLWPAMWNNAFNEDDPENPRLANEYGIVMGTSHQEPMIRAQKEWDRRYKVTLGSWNYAKNPDVLQKFWRDGIRRNRNYESIVTMGLRGADDTEMAPGGPSANMKMLEDIVGVQRNILAEEINRDVTRIPQMWCLYKEVQEYYNEGMRVPDDVTLLWAEDNWGNIRRVPSDDERKRSGGAGIYYHFDYHGGPRSYQWINTSPLPKIWDQMTFARQYGADRIWIVNVGHLKAYPFPMQYFLDLAWYGDSLTSENIREYTKNWVIQQFGTDDADETADIMALYTRFNGRRKPELLSPETYSLVNYHEAEAVVSDYNQLVSRAEKIYNHLPVEKKDAFYQLVLFPVKASALVNSLYLAAAKNNLYAQQCRASANAYAEEVQQLFSADTSLMAYYNKVLAGGKWNHFMDQPHLGYISWRDPAVNNLQHISLKNIEVPEMADMGVSIQGSVESWPGNNGQAGLPEFDIFNNQTHFIEIFNKGSKPFEFEISADPWILLSESTGMVGDDKRIHVRVNWNAVPEGKNQGIVTVKGTGKTVEVRVEAFKPVVEGVNGFTESNGCVSMEAEHYTKNTPAGDSKWIRVEDFGHTLSGMRATSVPGVKPLVAGENAPCLEYRMYLFTAGEAELISYVAPTLNFLPGRSVNYAISVDDQTPKVVTIVPANFDARNGNRDWEKTVSDNYRKVSSKVMIDKPGQHTLKIWMVDPGVVLQKIVLDMGGVKPSYLGPPESVRR